MKQEALKSKLAACRRTAYLPACNRLKGPDRWPDRSKFGGVAWINEGERWPRCGHCDKPMELFLQLNLSHLPVKVPGWPENGFVQVFYCTTKKTRCEQTGESAFSPFGRFLCARVLEATPNYAFDDSPVAKPLHPSFIVGWIAKDEYPSPDELKQIAPDLLSADEYRFLSGAEGLRPTGKDKLGGWQVSPQDIRLPPCPECGAQMEYVFQIDSNDHLDYMFGDSGIAHLFRCASHPNILGFSWAGC